MSRPGAVETVRRSQSRISHVEEVMGTVVSFDVRLADPADAGDAAERIRAACASLHEADDVFSTWNPMSAMSRVRSGTLAVGEAPPQVAEVLALCARVKTLSGGWFDPWALPGGVDPTGLVKGWAAERALRELEVPSIGAALVNAGGDIAAFGRHDGADPWRIGIRHPWRPDRLACVVEVDAAVATSGTYERGRHLFDPRTASPGVRAASATVTGPRLSVADALATALAVGGDDALEAIGELRGYEGYLVRPDGTERWTRDMPFAPTP